MAGRIPRLTSGFRRSLRPLGIHGGSVRSRAIGSTVTALTNPVTLPGPGDYETAFHPGRAHVRRVQGQNLWILYRFDAVHVEVLTIRSRPFRSTNLNREHLGPAARRMTASRDVASGRWPSSSNPPRAPKKAERAYGVIHRSLLPQ